MLLPTRLPNALPSLCLVLIALSACRNPFKKLLMPLPERPVQYFLESQKVPLSFDYAKYCSKEYANAVLQPAYHLQLEDWKLASTDEGNGIYSVAVFASDKQTHSTACAFIVQKTESGYIIIDSELYLHYPCAQENTLRSDLLKWKCWYNEIKNLSAQ